jgi:hypothetical protein
LLNQDYVLVVVLISSSLLANVHLIWVYMLFYDVGLRIEVRKNMTLRILGLSAEFANRNL